MPRCPTSCSRYANWRRRANGIAASYLPRPGWIQYVLAALALLTGRPGPGRVVVGPVDDRRRPRAEGDPAARRARPQPQNAARIRAHLRGGDAAAVVARADRAARRLRPRRPGYPTWS